MKLIAEMRSSIFVVNIKVYSTLTDLENTEFGVNPNWELLAPRGFRFYMPGSVGPGWLDETTTAQVESRTSLINSDDEVSIEFAAEDFADNFKRSSHDHTQPTLRCVAQECPTLLRKGLLELFPGCAEVGSPQLTIVTVSQKLNPRGNRWSREMETEKLAKFVRLPSSLIQFFLQISLESAFKIISNYRSLCWRHRTSARS